MADKKFIINLLNEIADMMEFTGENPFKVNAYRNGAGAIRKSEEDLDLLINNKTLDKIKGIGKGLQSVIYEYCNTGRSALYDELRKEIPDGLEQLLKIKGLGAKKIRLIYDELGISTVGELEYACKENRLTLLKGFGSAVQDKILREIENLRKYSSLILLNTGYMFADEIGNAINNFTSIVKKEVTGELRRGLEIISHIEFVLQVSSEKIFLKELGKRFEFEKQEHTIRLKDYAAVPVSFYIVSADRDFIHTLFITTGSMEFVEKVRNNNKIEGIDETEILNKLGFPYVIPEMREHEFFDYTDKVNSDLEIEGLKGLLHFHTTWSDGRNTLEEMISNAQKKGYLYAAVCDHSRTAFYANGLDNRRILLQYNHLQELSKKYSILLFQGIESDILQDGSLDYPEDFLSNFHFVVASIHSRFKMDESSMTARMIRAIENPYTDLLAHPSGRLLLSRDPYGFNVIKVIDACAANKVALEINSNPRRLDLDWRYINYAKEKGVLFSINSDAHSVDEIDLVKYGIVMGRKGALKRKEVINYFSPEEFYKFVNRKVTRKKLW